MSLSIKYLRMCSRFFGNTNPSLPPPQPATEQPQTKSLVDIQLPDLNEIELKKDIKKHPSTSTTKQHVETGGVMGGEEAEWEDDDSDWTDDELQLPKVCVCVEWVWV